MNFQKTYLETQKVEHGDDVAVSRSDMSAGKLIFVGK